MVDGLGRSEVEVELSSDENLYGGRFRLAVKRVETSRLRLLADLSLSL